MSIALALRLIASGAVSATDAEAALLSSLARRMPFVRALIDTGAIGEALLERELEQLGGIGLRQVSGMPELVNRLPPHFCRRMAVLPVRVDHAARVVEVAAADSLDPHIGAEVAFHLGVPVRVLRAPISAIEDAIRRIELEAAAAAGRARRATPPFPHGAPESTNPPPPPPEAKPIPLVKKSDKPPDTLRLYRQTLPPGEEAQSTAAEMLRASQLRAFLDAGEAPEDLDFSDAPAAAASTLPQTEPIPLRNAKTRDTRSSRPAAEAPASAVASQVAAPLVEEWAPAPEAPARPRPPGAEPPAVSFPSLPPPSVLDEPGLLPADQEWSPPPPAPLPKSRPSLEIVPSEDVEGPLSSHPLEEIDDAPQSEGPVASSPTPVSALPSITPGPPPSRPRRPSRFVRPSIDFDMPQPPSENRARRQRAMLDVSLSAGEEDDEEAAGPASWRSDMSSGPASWRSESSSSSVGPASVRGVARPELEIGPALDALRTAASRDDVVAAGLRGLRTVGRRTAIFVVRREGYQGWACNVELGEEEALRRVSVPQDAPSIFATAIATGTYFGPIPSNAVHAGLLAVLEETATDVAVAAARAGGKPVMLLFADDLVDIKRRVMPRLTEIADTVGAALSRLLAARL